MYVTDVFVNVLLLKSKKFTAKFEETFFVGQKSISLGLVKIDGSRRDE
jgi:hypothetical protein